MCCFSYFEGCCCFYKVYCVFFDLDFVKGFEVDWFFLISILVLNIVLFLMKFYYKYVMGRVVVCYMVWVLKIFYRGGKLKIFKSIVKVVLNIIF